ncbi:NfeD family protein [Conexibacter sp. SYSU D00693]|uniref:NfeD family protein n=1 Tax=Conexibacter sp. SYSU D00693 TaxID=2812560 RepID=UPI001F11CC9A|nr:NfeD family protein [Conexibacter sp. SYSU D00693]
MEGWLVWLIAAVVAAVGEMLTLGFFLAPFALGASGALVVDLAGGGTVVALAVFAAVTATSFLALRPVARRHLRQPPSARTGVAALVGRTATVIDQVTDDAGTVRLEGEVWTARPYEEGEVLDPGARVHVVEIRGATALVSA